MIKKLLQEGAEAKIFLIKEKGKTFVVKERTGKKYRLKELDEKIRKRRTKSEIKLLKKAGVVVNCPKVLEEKSYDIKLEYIVGKKLSENLDSFPLEKQKYFLEKIGEILAKIHNENIIHGDLTTSNLIVKKEKIYLIDFGLGSISNKIEDKAVDLHLFKQALEAKHSKNFKNLFQIFLTKYKKEERDSKEILERLVAVERRGRYKKTKKK